MAKKIEKINFSKIFGEAMNLASSPGNAEYRQKEALADKINELVDAFNALKEKDVK